MRLVLDTNVLISGVFWRGTPHRLLKAWALEQYDLVVSQPILDEYRRTLDEMIGRYGQADLASRWIGLIATHAEVVAVAPRFRACRDADDNKYVDCAVQGGADMLVTGDDDLLVLGNVSKVDILTPAEALKMLTR